MNITKQAKFISAIILQLLIVAAIIIFKSSIIAGGTSAFFKVEPVDPRDIFRGDYMVLSYENISRIDRSLFEGEQIRNGANVYVEIRQEGDYWMAVRATNKKPASGTVYLKGVVGQARGSGISVIYRIEEYFIPEGTGQNLDLRNGNPYVEVAIDKNGNAVLKKLYMYGKPYEDISREEIETLEANQFRANAKDSRIIADIRQMQIGLELYFDMNEKYPTELQALAPKFMSVIPRNSLDERNYDYCSDGKAYYVLGGMLANENNNAMLSSADKTAESKYCDPNQDTVCGQAGYFCVVP